MKMNSIGSDMPPQILKTKTLNKLSDNHVWLSTGRDCLEYIIQSLALDEKDTVLLPAYLCPEMLTPFENHGVKIRFYKITKDLTISSQDFLGEISKGDVRAALIINYFGWPDPGRTDIRMLCNKHGVVLIEDCAQSPFSKFPLIGDLKFYTFRKSLPVPDGASISDIVLPVRTNPATNFARTRLKAGMTKNPVERRALFIKAEKELVNKYTRPAKMLKESEEILCKLDFARIAEIRRKNYLFLAQELQQAKGLRTIYPFLLMDDVVPFGLPIICDDRELLKEKLISKKIFPPIHWAMPKAIDRKIYPDSHWLSERILTIPVDQRYDEDDMKRISKVLRED